jgi:pimeloyl-ACP methyl ester carboxylesterase
MRPLYESMDVPTLILWGDSDSVTPVAQGRDLAKLIPAAKLVELPGVGHIPAMEAPDQFDAALLAFLGSANVNSATPADPAAAPPSHATSRAQQKRRP